MCIYCNTYIIAAVLSSCMQYDICSCMHDCDCVYIYIDCDCVYIYMRRWMDLSETGDTPNSWPSWWGKFTTLPDKISMPRVASDNANRMLKYSNLWLPTSWLINIAMEIHVSHSDFFLFHGSSISFSIVFWRVINASTDCQSTSQNFPSLPFDHCGRPTAAQRQGSAGDVFFYSEFFGATVGIDAEV